MSDDPFRCRCPLACNQRATQEDARCDTCRGAHMHVAPVGSDPTTPATPIAMTGTVTFT